MSDYIRNNGLLSKNSGNNIIKEKEEKNIELLNKINQIMYSIKNSKEKNNDRILKKTKKN